MISGAGFALVNRRRYALRDGKLRLIEHGDEHTITNDGKELLRTLNFYVPPAYTQSGAELPRGKD